MAAEFYREASVFFQKDEPFSHFLGFLAREEQDHADIMERAEEYFQAETLEMPAFITVDKGTKNRVEVPFMENRDRLLAGDLTKEDMVACIASTEFSEWNDVFLYVVNTLKQSGRAFEGAAAEIQQHKRKIESFLKSLPNGGQYLDKVEQLPPVWETKILVVDDSEPIVELLKAILRREGLIETAQNGKEALEKTAEHYFDVIVSDIDMPVLNGMEFYDRAVQMDAKIGKRFLFFTGALTPERLAFFERNNLQYLVKSLTVDKIKQAVAEIIKRPA
jgi:two-component system chemotaxis response regulator CheY